MATIETAAQTVLPTIEFQKEDYSGLYPNGFFYLRMPSGERFCITKDAPKGSCTAYETRAAAQLALEDRVFIDVEVRYMCEALEKEIGLSDDCNYEADAAKIRAWLTANNGTYYSGEKDNCFEWEAVAKARREGKTLVIIENLS